MNLLKRFAKMVFVSFLVLSMMLSVTAFADTESVAETEPETTQIVTEAENNKDQTDTETTTDANIVDPETTLTEETEALEESQEENAAEKTTEESEGGMLMGAKAQEEDPAVADENDTKETAGTEESEPSTESETEPATEPEPEPLNGWDEEHTCYYVNDEKVTGLYEIEGVVYGFNTDGKLVKNTWLTIDGVSYGIDEEGKLYTENTLKEYTNSKGGKYYRGYNQDGKMVKGSWLTVRSDTYGFDKNGMLQRNTVQEYRNAKGGAYYRGYDKNGKMVKNNWLTVGGSKYYFNANGSMLSNTVTKIGSYYYGFGNTGKMLTGFQTIKGNKYYFNPSNGQAYVNGLKTISGGKYLFAADGKMLTGWQKVSNKTCYFNPSNGKLSTGLVKINGKSYLLNSNGVKITSTGTYNGKYVIIKSNGEVLTGNGWTMYNGYKYYIESDGYTIRTNTESLVKGKSLIIKVNKNKCVITVYAYDSATKKYDIPVKSFVCSTGKRTPLGRHYLKSKNRWVKLVGATEDTNTWGQWGMFYNKELNDDGTWSKRFLHSVYYDNEKDANSLNVRAWNMLGKVCSHGCIRLESVNVKWLYDNKSRIKYVQIYNGSSYGPFGKRTAVKLPSWHTWDPTDPTMHYKCTARGCH